LDRPDRSLVESLQRFLADKQLLLLLDNFEQDVRSCEEGLVIFRELNDKTGIAQAMNILGELARSVGDYVRAREVYEASMAASQETGETFRQIFMLNNLSYVAYQEGDYQKARELAASCLQQMLEIDARSEAISALGNLAGPLSKLGEPLKAARLLGASAALKASMGVELQPSGWHENAKYRVEIQRQLGEAAFEAAWAEGQAMTLEKAVSHALENE
jgi:tetratricopeptide (TPR) repeat protein